MHRLGLVEPAQPAARAGVAACRTADDQITSRPSNTHRARAVPAGQGVYPTGLHPLPKVQDAAVASGAKGEAIGVTNLALAKPDSTGWLDVASRTCCWPQRQGGAGDRSSAGNSGTCLTLPAAVQRGQPTDREDAAVRVVTRPRSLRQQQVGSATCWCTTPSVKSSRSAVRGTGERCQDCMIVARWPCPCLVLVILSVVLAPFQPRG